MVRARRGRPYPPELRHFKSNIGGSPRSNNPNNPEPNPPTPEPMKYVIIGGGIAGLAIGASLIRKGKEVIVSEKQPGVSAQGHAFLLHDDAVSILRQLNLDHNRKMPGERISLFSLRRPDGSEIKCEELRTWTCMKRSDLLEYMESLLRPADLRHGRSFSHFLRQQGRVVAAAFTNGETEY